MTRRRLPGSMLPIGPVSFPGLPSSAMCPKRDDCIVPTRRRQIEAPDQTRFRGIEGQARIVNDRVL